MNRQLACMWLWSVWMGLAIAACSFDDARKDDCIRDDRCVPGYHCEGGYCVRNGADTEGPSPRDGSVVGSDADSGPTRPGTGVMMNPTMRSDAGGMTPAADSGPPMTPMDAGTMTPGPCRNGDTRACMLPSNSAERCRAGTQTCKGRSFGACEATQTPSTERCNDVDDDCDGKTDEAADERCYPAGTPGCVMAQGRATECNGICSEGTRACRNGTLAACTGATTPQQESCTMSGSSADENCDGAIDEVCSCTAGEMRSCYTAASGTINVGTCKAGRQVCTNGALGACVGAVVPQAETCMNEASDDNCNGMIDDIPDRGARCTVASNMGVCREGILQCQGGRAELTCATPRSGTETCNMLDDDCDGKVDETTQLQTDNANCGACGRTCTIGQTCCAGACTNVMTDNANCGACGAPACGAGSSCCGGMCQNTLQDNANCGRCGQACGMGETCCGGTCVNTNASTSHCGGCGLACTTGTQPECCAGKCVDLVSQDNCGQCGRPCGAIGGLTCTCGVTADGTVCIAPVAGLCL